MTDQPPPPRRELLDTGVGDDDGAASPEVEAALTAYDRDASTHRATLAVLQHSRLLVPVVAMLGRARSVPTGWSATRPPTWPRC